MGVPEDSREHRQGLPRIDLGKTISVAGSIATIISVLTVGAWIQSTAPQVTPFPHDGSGDDNIEALQSQLDAANRRIVSMRDELADANELIRQLESELAESEAAASGTAPEESEGSSPEEYAIYYEEESLALNGRGCQGPTWIDLDEPRVVHDNIADATDIEINTCAGPPRFEGPDVPIAEAETVSADECLRALRSRPVNEVGDLEDGMVVCVVTERDRIAALEITNVDDFNVEVIATVWEEKV